MSGTQLNPLNAIVHDAPYSWYSELVREKPFYFDQQLNLWIAADADSITAMLEAPQLQVRPMTEPVPAGLIDTAAGEVFGRLVRMREGDWHHQLKKVIVQALVNADTQQARLLAKNSALARLERNDEINELLFAVPATVVSLLCGFVDEDVPEMVALIAEFVLCIPASASMEQQQRASLAAAKLLKCYASRLEEVREGSLLSALVHAAVAETWTDQAGLIANAIGLLSQTYDATAGLIGNALVMAQRYPQAFREAPLIAFVEEVARFDAPIQNTRRFAAETFSWRGEKIASGEAVLLLLAAANRDPQANFRPDEFIPGRAASRCFTFSHGRHRCPGSDLAVAIASGFIEALQQHNADGIATLRRTGYRASGNARIPELTL